MEICVLQDNAELLKSQNASLNEEAKVLSLQMTVCSTTFTFLLTDSGVAMLQTLHLQTSEFGRLLN